MASTAGTRSTLQNVTDDQKRWLVFGIALNKVLVTQIHFFVEQEIQKEYGNLQTRHNIHTQSTAGRLKNWPTFLKYENINGNDAYPRLPGGRYNYSLFDCRVTSHVDFAKLYVENHMAKFNAFDEHCDASAVLSLLAKVPVFSHAVQSAAVVVKQARNAWAHCVFRHWDLLNFQQCFADMEQLVKALGLPSADETDLLKELKDWEMKGAILCMNATIDPDLVKTVQQDVSALKNDVDKLAFEEEVNRENLKKALQNAVIDLEELQKRVAVVEHEQEVIKEEQSSLCEEVKSTQGQISELKSEQQNVQQHVHDLKKCLGTRATQGQISELKSEQEDVKRSVHDLGEHLDTRVSTLEQEQEIIKQDHSSLCDKVSATQGWLSALQSGQEDVQQRVTCLEDQQNRSKAQISYEIANCEAEISFFAGRHDKDTRQWLLEDFDKWFNDPGDSRAYVLLGDPGVGKSVIAGVLAQRSKKVGSLGAAYFCRHNDGTRNDPRCLIGTVACQLCECNSEYTSIVGGEDGVRNLLGNYKLGVQELFTKLLQEPLGKCNPSQQRKLVVIDALDETQYESRDDVLDLIMNRFPILPKWLVFFITSRPENTVQLRLKKYNPCVRICAGNVEHHNFFQQHDQDIKLFLRKNADVSGLPFSVDDVANKCKGSFLYAFYIAKDLNVAMQSGKSFQLGDLFPGDFDTYLLKNFKRVFAKVGSGLFKKLFGCAIVAPAPLPVSFISYVLQKENSIIDRKHVVDALSLFMVLTKTFAFLHNLIPAWLTDEEKAEELFINRNIEAKYLKDIILEILFCFIHEESEDVALIKTDLLDYVLSVGIRFLCGIPEKDSLETVFNCLTSFRYIQNRIQSRRIESYALIEDLRLAADCFLGDGKKEILLGLCSALESNIFVLLECPHLLHVCLQNASEAVQKNIVIPVNMSTARLQWNSWACPVFQSRNQIGPYAVSPDGMLLAREKNDCIFLYDSFSMEVVLGPVKPLSHINHLEFSSDGRFLFYGRLDKWLSVEEGCIEKFPQFAGKNESYEWGSITADQQCIEVKRIGHPTFGISCCELCMLNFLCLWATAEISQGQESETICGCFPDRLSVENVHSEAEDQDSPVPAMRSLLNVLKRTKHDDWCRLMEKLQVSYPFERCPPRCVHCESRKSCDTSFVPGERDFIIKHYSMLFEYQVWDLQTGESVLEQAFSSGIQMSPFTYLCHLRSAREGCGVLFSGIDKAISLCNIALLNTVWHHLNFFNAYREELIEKEFKLFESVKCHKLDILCTELRLDIEWHELRERRKQRRRRKEIEKLEWIEQCGHLNLTERLDRLEWLQVCEQLERRHYLAQREWLKRHERLELERRQVREQRERVNERERCEFTNWLGNPYQHFKQLEHHAKSERLEHCAKSERLEQLDRLEHLAQREHLQFLKRLKQLEWLEVRTQFKELAEHAKHRFVKPEWYKWLKQSQRLEQQRRLKRLERLEECEQRELQLLERFEWFEQHEKLKQRERLEQHEQLQRLLQLARHNQLEWRKRPEKREQLEETRLLEAGLQRVLSEQFAQFKQFVHLLWYHLESKKIQVCNNLTNAPLEMQNLPDAKKKGLFINKLPCVSPDGGWVAMRLDGNKTTVHLYPGQSQNQHNFDCTNVVHVIKDVKHFAFSKDSVFFLYLTKQNSLHALSLCTGTIYTSVSGVRPLFFFPESQTGFPFRAHDEDNIIFLKDLPSDFLRFFSFQFVKKPIQAMVASADTILTLCLDPVLTVMRTKDDGRVLTTVSETPLENLDGEFQQVTKCQFSNDGKLIVVHRGTKILLYSTMLMLGSIEHGDYLALVYEREHEFNVVHFTFSADNTSLLFCILQGNNDPYFFVWNVEKKELSASFHSPRVMSQDFCCCFSSDNKNLIICTAFYIEIWDHAASPCRLLSKDETDVPCKDTDKFTHCTVSQENDILACCVLDRIFLYPLSTAANQSILQLPRAHLGKIEFCQFLKGNRYLISYGVDGMVFLWDLSEFKAIAYVKIAQGRETIVSMAVSPEEDKVVCLTSFWRLNIIKLCGLKCTTLSKLPLPKAMTSSKMTEAFQRPAEPTATIPSPAYPASTHLSVDLDVAELIEEMDFMLDSDVSEESDKETE